jgi:hypothetical protein
MRAFRSFLYVAAALGAAHLAVSPVHAETVDCTPVKTLPAFINAQGLYCLTGNLATAVGADGYNAITINANNVTLDLNGWKLGGQGAGTGTQAIGIYSDAANVTIKNGIVRGFAWGIWLTGRGAVVRDMLIDQNTAIGITVNGEGALVENNQVIDTGGSTASANAGAEGVFVNCSAIGAMIIDNTVSELSATGSGTEYGIYSPCAPNVTVRDNVVSDSTIPAGGGGSYGIYQFQSIALNNTVSTFYYGIWTASSGLYVHNAVFNCFFPYTGGTAGAGNSP